MKPLLDEFEAKYPGALSAYRLAILDMVATGSGFLELSENGSRVLRAEHIRIAPDLSVTFDGQRVEGRVIQISHSELNVPKESDR